ncbi:MAG: nucleoside monophosphate kinase [Bacilli bacterium]|nr:nucleoside monophosphate kinase [Bacilli bacterium]
MKNIILIAAPAAGKGTLSEMLVEKYGYVHISTGDLLRDVSTSDTQLGRTVSDMLSQGVLVTDEIVFEILENRLKQDDIKNGFILDGFPRTLEQAKKYDELISRLNIDLGSVIILESDYETLEKRIVGRMLCKSCGSVHNTLTGVNTPKVDNICNKCGGNLYKRSDDNRESFKTRYETFLEKTEPLIEFYQEKGNIHFVNSLDKETMLSGVEDILND